MEVKSQKQKFIKALQGKDIFELEKLLYKQFKNCEVYLVGGSVRDILLDRQVKDFDILVRKVKIKDLEKYLNKYGRVDVVGKRFSVLKFILRGGKNQFDIAIPRKDFAFETGGYRDFKIKSDSNLALEEDLKRRDFTINAMAWNIKSGELVDVFGGAGDLQNKKIKAVGKPELRFKEDYSRMLRAIRFAMQLGFDIEKNTLDVIKKNIVKINSKVKGGERKVAYEVIGSEFLKSFDAAPSATIKFYDKVGALKYIIPELLELKGCRQEKEWHSEGDVWKHTLLALDMIENKEYKKYFSNSISLNAKVGVLLHDIGKPKTRKKIDGKIRFQNHDKEGAKIAEKILNRLKLSASPDVGVDSEEIVWIIKNHLLFCYSDPVIMKKTTIEKYLFNKRFSGEDFLQVYLADVLGSIPEGRNTDLARFKKVMKIIKELGADRKQDLPPSFLNGDEVMKILNIKAGIKVGEVLDKLREEQLQGRIKSKAEAKKVIKNLT